MRQITGAGSAMLAALLLGGVAVSAVCSQETPQRAAIAPTTAPATQPTTRPVQAKPLSENASRGLNWLAQQQLENGGWGAGEESQHMRSSGQQIERSANVADTSVACLALLRSGSTPSDGPYATHIRRGVEFVCAHVEKADADSLFITDIRNTRLQSKLGTYVDTFAAALLLAEVKDRMGDRVLNKRVLAALDKVMDKIEKNQQADGGFANAGWAPTIAQGLCSKAVNRAMQRGYAVSGDLKMRTDRYAQSNFQAGSGAVAMEGAAGVELYARASNVNSLQEADAANRLVEDQLRQIVAAPATRPADEVAKAQAQLVQIQENRSQLAAATQAVVQRLDDPQFVAGFGSNGGEEFLSYMNIGETLVAQGGQAWEKWDKQMTENLNRIQNDDGSWSGHHCITGKTFCTSSALLVLMVDRAPQAAASGELKQH
ncbi:hypothetical protein [Fontivita pretiosa]|uniref:hypothetical protein n=1 Tax=Fontivita pretiosa TaxID=2989684 RepID=UPI003D185CA8